ncbi:MAG: 30S ribosomal protein S20 [Patescibacteria group bacterium]
MPIKAASAKHARQTIKRTAANRAVKNEFRDAIKKARKLITNKDAGAKAAVAVATKLLDKAARKKVITKNTAGRKKSRLMQALGKV